MFVLDTDVLSDLRKARKNPAVQGWMQQLDQAAFSTSVITIAEIQCGIERQMAHHPDYARQTQKWLDRFLAIGGATVHGVGVRAALLLARMHETAALRNFVLPDRHQQQPKTAADLAIAAIAIAENAVVATGNSGHFADINACFALPGIFNPFKGTWIVGPR